MSKSNHNEFSVCTVGNSGGYILCPGVEKENKMCMQAAQYWLYGLPSSTLPNITNTVLHGNRYEAVLSCGPKRLYRFCQQESESVSLQGIDCSPFYGDSLQTRTIGDVSAGWIRRWGTPLIQ